MRLWPRRGPDGQDRTRLGPTRRGLTQRSAKGRTSSSHRRFQQRATRVRRRPWKVAALVALFLAALGGVVFLFGWSRAFVVEEVVVQGVEGELAEAVRAQASVPHGRPLARVDAGAVTERVQQDLRVAQVEVGRSWPSTITLEVTAREPAIAVVVPGEPMRVADAQGIVYDEVAKKPRGISQLRVPSADAEPTRLRGAIAMRESIPEDLRAQMHGMRLLNTGNMQFKLGEVSVVWGPPEQPTLKSRVLQALLLQDSIELEQEDDEGAQEVRQRVTIDLSVPETPVVKGLPPVPEE